MSSYKVSYKMLGQHADDMIKLANQLGSDISTLDSIVPKISEDEMFQRIKTDLTTLIAQLNENCDLMGTAGNVLKECVEKYTDTEVKLVQQSEGTRAHSRDFYKNPVSVASYGGGGSVDSTPIGATTLDAGGSYSYTPAESSSGGGAESYTTRDSVSTGGSSFNTRDAAVGGGVSGAAVAAGAAAGVGAAAATVGGVFAAKKIKEKNDAKKDSPVENISDVKPKDDYDPAAELEKAKARLASLNE